MSEDVQANLAAMAIVGPTPIQMQAASIIHAERDLLACAPTGSGKTLAFLLPLLLLARDADNEGSRGPMALVVEPTRELARQVYTEASKLHAEDEWKVAIFGEDDEDSTLDDDEVVNQADVLITTPLKMVYAIKAGKIKFDRIQYLVLDEADR